MSNGTSKRFALNKVDLVKILMGAAMAIAGALVTYLTSIIGDIDFGQWTPIATALFAVLANTVRRLITDYNNRQ